MANSQEDHCPLVFIVTWFQYQCWVVACVVGWRRASILIPALIVSGLGGGHTKDYNLVSLDPKGGNSAKPVETGAFAIISSVGVVSLGKVGK
jgi:hypothetical protein